MTEIEIPFNDWSRTRIEQGRKNCTSRSHIYGIRGDIFDIAFHGQIQRYQIIGVCWLPLSFIKEHLFALEGADSPEEFEKVWRSIYRGHFNPKDEKCVHFFEEIKPEASP